VGDRELGSDEERSFFGAKAWALLHDPPHKMWIISGDLSIAGGGHENEARRVWESLGLSLTFGDPGECGKLVDLADDMASTSDRWITNFAFKEVRRTFRYNRLHNIFSPDLSLEIKPPERQTLEALLKSLASQISVFGKKPRDVYHALYALYEASWAAKGLPPSLADTRAPTHTLFDHVYATALTLNILWPHGEVGGYAVLIDIPGIQRIVGAARKAGDFWAGSWAISMLSWLSVWPLVWKYGADILLRPSPRLNPYYHAFLCAELDARDELWRIFESLYAMIAPGALQQTRPLRSFIKYPIVPGTAAFILPRRDLGGRELSCEQVEDVVGRKFDGAFELMLALASSERKELEGPYGSFIKLLRAKGSEVGLVKLFKAIKGEEPRAFEELLRPRIAVIDIGERYREWLKSLRGEGPLEDKPSLLKALMEAKSELLKLKMSEEEVSKRLVWQALIALLFEELSRKVRRKIAPPKAWFTLEGSSLKPIDDFERFYDKGGVGYLLCTTCGNEPAIIKLGKDVRGARLLEYNDDALDKLKGLGLSAKEEIEELKVSVKPGEALGPLCLMKRALYLNVRDVLELKFDSTEDVSINFMRKRFLDARLTEGLKSLRDGDGRRVAQYIEEKVRSFDSMLDQNPERAKSIYEHVLSHALRELAPKGLLSSLIGKTSEELARIYAIGSFQVPENFLTAFRSYYCILRADADNVGQLSRGGVKTDEYLKLLEGLLRKAEEEGEREVAEAFGRARGIVEVLLKRLKEAEGEWLLLPSPTYALTLSTALMVTALRDSINVEDRLYGSPIFSGGDDDLALLPIETGLAAVEVLRGTYHGEGGFHRVGSYIVPAPAVYGKSFSLRFTNILDLMADEVAECTLLLDEVAKKVSWSMGGGGFEKDALVISNSRSNKLSILPLAREGDRRWTPADARGSTLRALELMWLANLSLQLSAGVPEDYDRVKEAVEMAAEKDDWDVAYQAVLHVLSRNAPQGKLEGEVLGQLVDELAKVKRWKQRGGAPSLPEGRGGPWLSAFSWLIEAYRIVRGYP
jgi:CRISPR-associated protein Cmr2